MNMGLWLRFIMAGAMSIVFGVVGLVIGGLVHYVLAELTDFNTMQWALSYGDDDEVPFKYNFLSGLAMNGWQAGLIGGAIIGFLVTKDIKLRITTDG